MPVRAIILFPNCSSVEEINLHRLTMKSIYINQRTHERIGYTSPFLQQFKLQSVLQTTQATVWRRTHAWQKMKISAVLRKIIYVISDKPEMKVFTALLNHNSKKNSHWNVNYEKRVKISAFSWAFNFKLKTAHHCLYFSIVWFFLFLFIFFFFTEVCSIA